MIQIVPPAMRARIIVENRMRCRSSTFCFGGLMCRKNRKWTIAWKKAKTPMATISPKSRKGGPMDQREGREGEREGKAEPNEIAVPLPPVFLVLVFLLTGSRCRRILCGAPDQTHRQN